MLTPEIENLLLINETIEKMVEMNDKLPVFEKKVTFLKEANAIDLIQWEELINEYNGVSSLEVKVQLIKKELNWYREQIERCKTVEAKGELENVLKQIEVLINLEEFANFQRKRGELP